MKAVFYLFRLNPKSLSLRNIRLPMVLIGEPTPHVEEALTGDPGVLELAGGDVLLLAPSFLALVFAIPACVLGQADLLERCDVAKLGADSGS